MRSEITRHIERYLDTELGWASRFFSWRRELVGHYEEAYEHAAKAGAGDPFNAAAWASVVSEFGNVRDVARQIRSESGQLSMRIRMALFAAAGIMLFAAFGSGLTVLVNVPSATVVFLPAAVLAASQAARGTVQWKWIGNTACGFAIGFTMFAMYQVYMHLDNPPLIGGAMAVCTLSMLYAVSTFSPGLVVQLFALATVGAQMYFLVIMITTVNGALPLQSWASFDAVSSQVIRGVFAISVLSLIAGAVRFGPARLAAQSSLISMYALLLSFTLLLTRLEGPADIIPSFLLVFTAMVGTALACVAAGAGYKRIRRISYLAD